MLVAVVYVLFTAPAGVVRKRTAPPLIEMVPVLAAMSPVKMAAFVRVKKLNAPAPVSVVVPAYVIAPALARLSLARSADATQFPATPRVTLFVRM